MRSIRSFTAIVCGCFLFALAADATSQNRTIDGTGNNLAHPEWGSVGVQLRRANGPAYADGVSAPAGPCRPSPRLISNTLNDQDESIPNPWGQSDYVWVWGQFVDHDLTLTEPVEPHEPFYIMVPPGDPIFDPDALGNVYLPLNRSIWDPATGTGPDNPRQQIEQVTSFLDASMVYGSDPERAAWLREGVGGRLKVTPHPTGDLLPYNDGTQHNQPNASPAFFVAGDIRVNEHAMLTSIHTVFVREHNRLAALIAAANPSWTDEQIYQKARKIVGAEVQVITYKEFLPTLFRGPAAGLAPYTGYKPDVNPTIYNAFANAAFRFGHTKVNPVILRVNNHYQESAYGPLELLEAFFNPSVITDQGGIDPILRGLACQLHQKIDLKIIDTLRNNLFAMFDLPSLNIQRGRDHGLPDYNSLRVYFGLRPIEDFDEINLDPATASGLKAVYGCVDNIDPWEGMIAEFDPNGMLPSGLRHTIIRRQFENVRDGDRFWYEIDPGLTPQDRAFLDNLRLKDVIEMNTDITGLPDNVFYVRPCCLPDELQLTIGAILEGKKGAGCDLLAVGGGSFDALEEDLLDAESIRITVYGDEQTEPVFTQDIPVCRGIYRYDVFFYTGVKKNISLLRLDLLRHNFTVMARNLDLSGMQESLRIEIQVGPYTGEGATANLIRR